MSTSTSVNNPEEGEEASDNSSIDPRDSRSGSETSSSLTNLSLPSSHESSSRSRENSIFSRNLRSRSRANTLRAHRKTPIDRYLDFFEALVKDTINGQAYAGDNVYNTTQNGIVTWSPDEKEALFNGLARKGRDAIPQIATLIGSKSEVEVRDYLGLLQQGLERQHLIERHSGTVSLGDIPAAFEISEECCQALEVVAEAISLKEEQRQNKIGRRRHGPTWRIDRAISDTIENEIELAEDGEHAKFSVFAVAKLFNIGNWIELSERIFMNAGEQQIEDNWTSLTFKNETPSMTCEAFSDFYALAVSITRRLVQSSIFFATSRLRAVERGGYHCKSFVRSDDVNAVLEVLKMKPNSKGFWAGVARRCRLDVEDIRHRKGWPAAPLTYDEVEERLTGEAPDPNISSDDSISWMPPFRNRSREYNEAPDNIPGSVSSPSSPSLIPTDENLSDPEELHASIIDQRASHAEELRLWNLLKVPSPPSLPPAETDIKMESGDDDEEDNKKAPNERIGKRKTQQDLVDWRDRILYRSEWEEFGPDTTAIDEEILEIRRKRPRIDYE